MEIAYAPSISWYTRWLGHSLGECPMPEAGARPNRCTIASGEDTMMLTVPIEGGGRLGKKGKPSELLISNHGRWPAVHKGALQAFYGKAPYYDHFAPEVFRVLDTPYSTLEQLDTSLHGVVCRCLGLQNPDILREIKSRPDHPAWDSSSKGSLKEPDSNLSIFHLLFREGPEAIFSLMRQLKSIPLLIILFLLAFAPMKAHAEEGDLELKVKAYTGYKMFVDDYGDEVLMTYIREIYVFPPLKFKNKKEEEFYWRTVRDVRKTLPYAKLAYHTLCETYEYIRTIPNEKERERHLKTLEHDIFEQYKPAIKSMTKTQGKVMLKLINRETDQSSYNIVKAFLGSFRAGFWQTFGRFFGVNMKIKYEPNKNKDDATIERIATLIEQGTL